LDAVRRRLDTLLREKASAARAATVLEIDGALTPAGVSEDFIDLVEKAGPYGQGNPSPRFAFPAHRVRYTKVMGEAHVRCTLEAGDGSKLDAIAFRAVGQPIGDVLQNSNGMPIHVAGHLRRDTWGGRNRIEFQIEDVAEAGKRGA
jgi:single-stranded-DNA-specific exonuclease